MTKKPMLRNILIAIPAIIVVFLIIVSMQPSSYRVTRSRAITATTDALFPHINDLKKWESWNPWGKADPNMKLTYGGTASGVGANYSWTGNREVGEGRLTIAESRPGELVRYKMEFFKPMSGRTMRMIFSIGFLVIKFCSLWCARSGLTNNGLRPLQPIQRDAVTVFGSEWTVQHGQDAPARSETPPRWLVGRVCPPRAVSGSGTAHGPTMFWGANQVLNSRVATTRW